MNTHVFNVYNRDNLPSTGSRLNKLGSFTVRHSTGEGYVVIEGGVEKPIKGDTYRKFIDFLKKNKVYDSIPQTTLELKNKNNIMLNADTALPDTMPTVSVHNILVEREYTNSDEWQGLAEETSVKLKRISFKTLGRDVEVEDLRLTSNENEVSSNGISSAEVLINAITMAPFELDPVFSEDSNVRLLTNSKDRASNKIKLKFNTLDNPMDVTEDSVYDNKILTGKAGQNIKQRVKEKIDALKIFSNLHIKNYLKDETISEGNIIAKDNNSILNIEATESEGISLSVDDGKLIIKHAEVGNRSTNIAPIYGEVRAIAGVETDDMGHVIRITTKDLSKEIAEIYPTKDVAGATYVKKVNLGTETIEGSVEIAKSLIVQKDVTISGNLYTKGQVTAANTKEFTIKDNILDIGSGNNTVYRYTGIKMNVSSSEGSGTDAADAYIVYDNVEKAFRVMYATEDPLDPNILIPVSDAPIKARNFIGNAKYANRFKNELSLQFTGDAQGSVKFYGDEDTIDVPVSVNKASTSTFGIVRLLESIDEQPVTNDVYSSVFLYTKLNKLSDFKLSHSYMPDETATAEETSKTIASLLAVYKVYNELYKFRQVYDAAALAAQAAALKNRTFTKSASASITLSIALDDTVTPSITGIGYDSARFDEAATVGEKFLEFWRATFKMKVIQKTDKVLFTVMEKTPNIEVIYLPIISSKKAPFGLTNNFKFEIRRYADANTSESTVIGTSLLYNVNKQYIADDVETRGAATLKENFYNHLDFSDYSIGSIISNYMMNRNSQTFKIKGQGASAYYNVISPFKTGGGVLKEKAVARYEKDSKGFSVSLSDIDHSSPYVVAIYFKKTDSSADDTIGLNCVMREYRVDGTYIDKKMGTIDKDTFHVLANGSWFCYYAYVRQSSGEKIIGDIFGVYNMTGDKNQRLSFNDADIQSFSADGVIHDDSNVVRREFHLNKGSKSVIEVLSPVLMKRNSNWTVSNFIPDNDDDLFLVASNSYDEDIRYVEFRIDAANNKALQKQYYSIVCVSDGDFNNALDLKLATATTFGTIHDVAHNEYSLLENGKTADSKELTVNTNYSNEYAVALTVKRKTAVKDTVVQHEFFAPKVTEDDMNGHYFIPKNTHAVHVTTNNTGVGVVSNAIFVYNETGVDAGKWTYFAPTFEVIRDVPSYADLINWYGPRSAGDYVVVNNDPNQYNGASWYYHDGLNWNPVRLYHPNMFLEILNLDFEADLATHTTDNVPYKLATTTDTQKFFYWNATSETEGEWVLFGTYYGRFKRIGVVDTYAEFEKKFKKICVADYTHAQVTVNNVKKRFIYRQIGENSSWGNENDSYGDFVDYTAKFIVPIAITDPEEIKNFYQVPHDGTFTVVSTQVLDGQGVYPYLPTDEYYKFIIADGSGAWVKQGTYAQYKPPIADYAYTGEITYAGGAIEHDVFYSYKYVAADLTT